MIQRLLRWPGGVKKALCLSYDDGTSTDLPLLDVMRTYGIKGSFHLSAGYHPDNGLVSPPAGLKDIRLPLAECVKNYDPALCEVAAHGFSHLDLSTLQAPQIVQQLYTDRQILERAFGRRVDGFSYPMGGVNERVVNVAQSCGMAYARTTKSTGAFTLPENWLLWHPTTKHTDPNLPRLTENFLQTNNRHWPMLFMLWGHSAEFNRDKNWHVIEEFCKTVSGQENIWYATCGEICAYAKAFNRLVFSADGTLAYNPTATDLWIYSAPNQEVVKIPAGQQVKLA